MRKKNKCSFIPLGIKAPKYQGTPGNLPPKLPVVLPTRMKSRPLWFLSASESFSRHDSQRYLLSRSTEGRDHEDGQDQGFRVTVLNPGSHKLHS